jgi:hypothetical protein
MKKFIHTFGFLALSCLLSTACSVEVNEDGEKKTDDKESTSMLSTPSEEAVLMASNDYAFARKGCKYRW